MPPYYGQLVPTRPQYYGQLVPTRPQYYGQLVPTRPQYYGQLVPTMPQYYGQLVPTRPQYYVPTRPYSHASVLRSVSTYHALQSCLSITTKYGHKVVALAVLSARQKSGSKRGVKQQTSLSDLITEIRVKRDLTHVVS
ncbi:hypothetical protein RRG08_020298 [Elysia crispata]|uniref:Uncharacterized protein n=1 Tax=Elysia crispata TaxID=231223 RepID=A0AAE1EBX5_9GAST|nr:hypothetical protein RRG08_020298 [Elysia crispata]